LPSAIVEPLAAAGALPPLPELGAGAVAVRVAALLVPEPTEPLLLPWAPLASELVGQGAVVVVVVPELEADEDVDVDFDLAGCVVDVVVDEQGAFPVPRAWVPVVPTPLVAELDPVPWRIGLWAANAMA
jgi:hypothetical protein